MDHLPRGERAACDLDEIEQSLGSLDPPGFECFFRVHR
jgi:hypothetical protein